MFKRFVAVCLKPLVILLRYLQFASNRETAVVSKVREIAINDSAVFVSEQLNRSLLLDTREGLWDVALENAKLSGGLFIELGVWNGYSISHLAKRKPSVQFFGFDSFEGLAEDWSGTPAVKGTFSRGGNLPKVPANVELIPGWFEDTLPRFTESHNGPLAFLHLDADTYESTKLALDVFAPWIVAGTVLVFDEHHGYPNWRNGEFRAWNEFVEERKTSFQYLAFSEQQAVIEILGSK